MFIITYPWLLLLLPLPFIIRYCLPRANQKQNALKIPFFTHIAKVKSQIKHFDRVSVILKKITAFIIWVLLVFAVCNPKWLGDPIQLPQQGRDIMLAVDISRSMEIPDMSIEDREVDRLTAVKSVAEDFIQNRQGDRLGLILFGSKAYLQTPLTFDLNTVKNMLLDASIGLAGSQTAIGDAIGLGIKRLVDMPKQSRVLILLTDGQSNAGSVTPKAAAQLAAENGVRIYTIAFGADELVIPGVFGPQIVNPSADLDTEVLEEIAELTHGKFFRAKDTEGLKQVYQLINKLEPVSHEELTFRPSIALYPWPLGAALLLSVLLALQTLWTHLFLPYRRQKTEALCSMPN